MEIYDFLYIFSKFLQAKLTKKLCSTLCVVLCAPSRSTQEILILFALIFLSA